MPGSTQRTSDRHESESDVSITSIAASVDFNMNTKATWKSFRTTEKEENASPNKPNVLQKKIMASDYMTQQKRHYKGDSNKKKTSEKVLTATHDPAADLKGYVNLLFCCDEEDDPTLPTLSVECRRKLGGRGNGLGQLQDATDLQFMDQSKCNTLLVTDLVNSRLQIFLVSDDAVVTFKAEDIIEPWASAVTSEGRIAVTSRKTKKVVLLGRDGRVEGSFGDSTLSSPSGIAVTAEGNFIVTDLDSSNIYVFSPSGDLIRQLGDDDTQFDQPRYVTVSRHGDIIVSDSGNHRLAVFDKDLNFVRTIGTFGKQDGCLKFPHAACTDDLGNILVCDRYNDRISAFTRKGDFVRHLVTSAHNIHHPQGLALSPSMDLYVSHGSPKAQTVMVLDIKTRTVEQPMTSDVTEAEINVKMWV